MKLVFLTLAACLFTLITKMGHADQTRMKQVTTTPGIQKKFR